ncbi:MAG: hypothetical protein U0105_04675 [Candidatus Obscuribacterales bacterium]
MPPRLKNGIPIALLALLTVGTACPRSVAADTKAPAKAAVPAAAKPVDAKAGAAPAAAPATKPHTPSPIDKTFLQSADFPAGYKLVEEHYGSLGDQPKAFTANKGVESGIKVYEGPLEAPLNRIVDIRWTFPTEKQAKQFLQDCGKQLGEGADDATGWAKPRGSEGKVFGGANPLMLRKKTLIYHWYYVFREGRVVVKLYGSEGLLSKRHPGPDDMLPFAEAAIKRCKGF